jgi:hypothetical protein
MKNQEKERLYEQILSPYVPNKSFTLHFINSSTPEKELIYLCNVIKSEIHFVFDTELDIHGYVPAIIQLLVMSTSSASSFMLLIETCFLSSSSSQCFDIIKELFRNVFRDGTYLYSWGVLTSELQKFEHYKLFPSSILSKLIDIQELFTKWFDSFLMENMDIADSANSVDDSLIINAPESMFELFLSASEINRIKITNNQFWSLQDSVAYILHKYLSKRETCRSWAIGLDIRLSSRNKNYSYNYRQRLIKYASHDCLSLMELIWFIYEQYLNHHSRNEDYVQTLGEYFSFLKQKFTSSISSFSVKNQQQRYDSLFYDTDDDSDDMLTVHELNERQPSSLNHSAIQQTTAVDPLSIEQTTTNDRLSIEQTTTNDFLPIEQTTTNDLLSSQQPSAFDFPASQQMILVDQQSNSQPQVIVSPVVTVNQHPDIPTAQRKTKRKPRRSVDARKRRNQQSSLRHRRNRYIFELQRPTNIDVTTVKNILHEYNIKYTNVNPVQSVICIGVHSQQQQQLYDKLLPGDIFFRT